MQFQDVWLLLAFFVLVLAPAPFLGRFLPPFLPPPSSCANSAIFFCYFNGIASCEVTKFKLFKDLPFPCKLYPQSTF